MYLDILHVFHTYPSNESKIHFTIHIRYIKILYISTCILGASLVSHWIHIRIHQDTCILDSSSRYIRIHRDTKSRYMYLGRVMTTLQDTIRIHHDTCILDASSEPRWIHTRYARDTLQIHLGYVSWARSICPAVQGAQGAPLQFFAGRLDAQTSDQRAHGLCTIRHRGNRGRSSGPDSAAIPRADKTRGPRQSERER
jgi:hypothetical protein